MPDEWKEIDGSLPERLSINAWTGEEGEEGLNDSTSRETRAWAVRRNIAEQKRFLLPPPPVDPRHWWDERLGWGLVLPLRKDIDLNAQQMADDAPEPIRELVRIRSERIGKPVPVFRYRPDWDYRFTHLYNPAADLDIPLAAAPRGTASNALPHYLLLYGSPAEIPWSLQYQLHGHRAVGRLDLTGQALENYVSALLNDWKEADAEVRNVVVWSTAHDSMSKIMRGAIGRPFFEKVNSDPDLHAYLLDGDGAFAGAKGPATTEQLIAALQTYRPMMILTTSHGQTGPLSDPAAMQAKLGLPVGQELKALDPTLLLATWQPSGAIWYAHACCSAGVDSPSRFLNIVKPEGSIPKVLGALADLGAQVAPLPQQLLGAARPLRAFLGHVEPTFDWTIKQPATGQYLTSDLIQALYNNLYHSEPVGQAFRPFYEPISSLFTGWDEAKKEFDKGKKTEGIALYCQLASYDRQSLVLLGDPTALLPLEDISVSVG